VADRGPYDDAGDEPGEDTVVRRIHFGRRRARGAVDTADPLTAPGFADDGLVDLSSGEVEPSITVLPGPPPREVRPERPSLADPTPVVVPPDDDDDDDKAVDAPAVDPLDAEPHGLFKSFRRWWRQEAMTRAAHKRALATAEAIIRAQAVRLATAPVDKTLAAGLQSQSVHNVLALTDERFQQLGLRSDRLHDELAGIRRTLNDLRNLTLTDAPPERVAGAAVEAVGSLEERFDGLLIALSDEFRRRSEESERRISELLTMQSAELATLLESAVARLRDAIPEGFEEVKAIIPQEMALVRATIPAEFQRVRAVIPQEMERMRDHQREELDQLRAMSQKQIESLRASSIEEIDKIRSAIPDGFAEVKSVVPFEVQQAVRDALPPEIERLGALVREPIEHNIHKQVEHMLAENRTMTDGLAAEMIGAVTRLRSLNEQELRAIRDGNLEAIQQLGAESSEELARLRLLGMEAIREDQRDELVALREGAVREIAMLREILALEVARIRQVTEDELARVASAVPGGLERVREVTASELERFREITGEQLERVRWAIPSELERARGVGIEELEAIRREIAALSRAIHGTGDVWGVKKSNPPGRDASVEAEEISTRVEDLLRGMNRTADRLAEALHRGVTEIEREIARRP
jgi:hypothetical protein